MQADSKSTIKALTAVFAIILTAAMLWLTGCSGYEYIYERKDTVRVTVASSSAFEASWQSIEVERGADVRLTLTYAERGIIFESCDYPDYTAVNESENVTVIVLNNVRYPTFINIRSRLNEGGIYYDANGGHTFADNADGYIRWLESSTHPRVNTSSGIYDIARDGYTQIGWNTLPDGTGESVCLGGRVDPPEGKTLITLYAEWAEWTDGDFFEYDEIDGGISLKRYNGPTELESFVIPEKIDGKTVIGIEERFVHGIKADSLVLPDTMQYMGDRAFEFCDFGTLYMFDNIVRIDDRCFTGMLFDKIRINAVLAPRYLSTSEPAEFADKMDRLMLHADEKKIVFFAGCSMSYGIDSVYMQMHYPDYTIVDMGTMGGTNADLQLDCIIPFLGEGDIFIHAPEQASQFQLFHNKNCDKNIFILCEGNPDLISYMDMSDMHGTLSAFCRYNTDRLRTAGGSWSDDNGYHNDYGDVIIPRGIIGEDVKRGEGEYTYRMDYLTDESLGRMCDYYDRISAQGATVLFSYAPVNYHGLPEESVSDDIWLDFARVVENALRARGYSVISDVADYLMSGRYFYDTDYHLNESGRDVRTRTLADDMKKYVV